MEPMSYLELKVIPMRLMVRATSKENGLNSLGPLRGGEFVCIIFVVQNISSVVLL